jgi:glutathione S-transferase
MPSLSEEYTLYYFRISYFSGKLQGYLRYKELPHRLHEPSWWEMVDLLYPATGLMKVPVLQTPENEWLQDSTPMMEWLEQRHPEGRILPEDPFLSFACHLLEDYADEWLWRPALHYRWNFPVDAIALSHRFTYEFLSDLPMPRWFATRFIRWRQDRIYGRGDGIVPATRTHVESIYLRNLQWLQAIFETRPYLLGDKPCLADFGFFASMFRHFSMDPTPAALMQNQAPAVYEWVARMWNTRWSSVQNASWLSRLPEDWGPWWRDMAEAYLPYLHANAKAWQEGREHFSLTIQGTTYQRLPTVQYRAWCRERLQERFLALPEEVQAKMQAFLEEKQCWKPLWRDGVMPSMLHSDTQPPFCRPRKVGRLEKLWMYFTGTHWEVPHTTRPPSISPDKT